MKLEWSKREHNFALGIWTYSYIASDNRNRLFFDVYLATWRFSLIFDISPKTAQ